MNILTKPKDLSFELSHFQVEELEERLENKKWDSTPQHHTNECGGEALYCSCPINGGTEDTVENPY
jgi:hypothetical protein